MISSLSSKRHVIKLLNSELYYICLYLGPRRPFNLNISSFFNAIYVLYLLQSHDAVWLHIFTACILSFRIYLILKGICVWLFTRGYRRAYYFPDYLAKRQLWY